MYVIYKSTEIIQDTEETMFLKTMNKYVINDVLIFLTKNHGLLCHFFVDLAPSVPGSLSTDDLFGYFKVSFVCHCH